MFEGVAQMKGVQSPHRGRSIGQQRTNDDDSDGENPNDAKGTLCFGWRRHYRSIKDGCRAGGDYCRTRSTYEDGLATSQS